MTAWRAVGDATVRSPTASSARNLSMRKLIHIPIYYSYYSSEEFSFAFFSLFFSYQIRLFFCEITAGLKYLYHLGDLVANDLSQVAIKPSGLPLVLADMTMIFKNIPYKSISLRNLYPC